MSNNKIKKINFKKRNVGKKKTKSIQVTSTNLRYAIGIKKIKLKKKPRKKDQSQVNKKNIEKNLSKPGLT